jgi:hypothetical protein
LVEFIQSHPFVLLPTLLLVFAAVYLFGTHQIYRRKKHLPCSVQTPMRSPGQSVLRELQILQGQVVRSIGLPFFVILCAGVGYFLRSTVFHQPVTELEVGLAVLVCLGSIGCGLLWLVSIMRKRRRIRLNYDSKVTVGQALNALSPDGYRIFHDFPADRFNIDHIVVGAKGVFAIDTKACANRTAGGLNAETPAEYNGKVLYFPNGKDLETVERAERQADWLSDWIGANAGIPVAARAIVALPGWVVKRTSADGIPVVNPRQFSSLFAHIRSRPIPENANNRIVHHLERMCRNTIPAQAASDS